MTGSEVDQDGEPKPSRAVSAKRCGLMRMRRRRRRSSCLTDCQTDGSEARRDASTETVKV